MKRVAFFKVNTAGSGYRYRWPDADRALSPGQLDPLLPMPGCAPAPDGADGGAPQAPARPCVAYAAARPRAGVVLLVVGGFWPQRADEFGRPGLYAWHGLLCEADGEGEREDAEALVALLLELVSRYEESFEDVGAVLEAVAKDAGKEPQALRALQGMAAGSPGELPAAARAFFQACDPRALPPPPRNLVPEFPLAAHAAVPALLRLLLEREGTRAVAGGCLQPSAAYDYVSHPDDLPRFPRAQLTLPARPSPKPDPRRPARVSRDTVLASCLALLVLGAAADTRTVNAPPTRLLGESDRTEAPGRLETATSPGAVRLGLSGREVELTLLAPIVDSLAAARPDGLEEGTWLHRALVAQLQATGQAEILAGGRTLRVAVTPVAGRELPVLLRAPSPVALFLQAIGPVSDEELQRINREINRTGIARVSDRHVVVRDARGLRVAEWGAAAAPAPAPARRLGPAGLHDRYATPHMDWDRAEVGLAGR